MQTALLTQLPFPQAADAWLETRRYHLAPRTFYDYGQYVKLLSKFFGEMKLPEITGDMVRAYQGARRAAASPQSINKELGILIQMRRRINLPLIDYQRLMIPKEYEPPGRALDEEEEERLLRVCMAAANHPTWDIAALSTLLSMFAGLAPCEILSLKLKHCSLDPPQVMIPRAGAKRIKKERPVPLNPKAAFALKCLIDRAMNKCGAFDREHYLCPFRNQDHSYDPTKAARGWRSGLDHLLSLSDIECRRYDFRHHAVSKAMRNPRVSREGIMRYFGWASTRMFHTYFHENVATLEVVAAAIVKKPPQSAGRSSVSVRKLLNRFTK